LVGRSALVRRIGVPELATALCSTHDQLSDAQRIIAINGKDV